MALRGDVAFAADWAGTLTEPQAFAHEQRCLAFVFPPVEDFGIVPVEAMAAGSAVVVNRIGGAAESVEDGVSGVHFDPSDDSSFDLAVRSAATVKPENAKARALEFDSHRFQSKLRTWIGSLS